MNKKFKTFILILFLIIITNLLSIYIKNDNVANDLEYNDELVFQEYEDENSIKELEDINKSDYDSFIQNGLSKSKTSSLIEYREYVGKIRDFSELRRIRGFGPTGVELIEKYYIINNENLSVNKHDINKMTNTEMKYIGLSTNVIKKIIKYRNTRKIKSAFDLKDIIGNNLYEKVKEYIKYE